MVLYLSAVVLSCFSLLSFFPLFQDVDVMTGILFGIASILLFATATREANHTNLKTSTIKGALLFIINTVFQGIGIWIFMNLSQWIRELPGFTSLFKIISDFLNTTTGMENENLYLFGNAEYVYTLTANPGNSGVLYFLMISSGMIPIFFSRKNFSLKNKSFLVASLGLFIVFRFIILTALFLSFEISFYKDPWFALSLFYHNITGLLSFLPWLLICYIFFKNKNFSLPDPWNDIKSLRQHLLSLLLLWGSLLFLTLALFQMPSGDRKEGKVLIEEYYSHWSKSTKPMDEQWYSLASTYNYYTMRVLLNSYYDVSVNEKPLDSIDLSGYDVLILKIPTSAYPEKVINQIVSFVENGGGLWVIGDHTNVFGVATYLNPLLKHFGLALREDAVYHNVNGSFNRLYKNYPVSHPIIQKVPVFMFATPCSIEIQNPSIISVIPGITTKSYRADYSEQNFFPDTKANLNIQSGVNTLLAAGDFGKGKIALFSDSTVFSNFFIYLPGKPELALSIIAWLNHTPGPIWLKPMLFIFFLLFMTAFILKQRQKPKSSRNTILYFFTGALFFITGLLLANFLNFNAYSLPDEKRPLPKVSFIQKYSNIYLPYKEWIVEAPNDFNTFYIWAQRLGIRTIYEKNLDRAITNSKALFFLFPQNPFTETDLIKLHEFVKMGGKVFLFDDGNPTSTSKDFLKRYELSIEYIEEGAGEIKDIAGALFQIDLPIGIIHGNKKDETLLSWKGEKTGPVVIEKRVGKGSLFVFGIGSVFSNQNFGSENIIPGRKTKIINRLILDIYKKILETH